jgi:hypothetical protein
MKREFTAKEDRSQTNDRASGKKAAMRISAHTCRNGQERGSVKQEEIGGYLECRVARKMSRYSG